MPTLVAIDAIHDYDGVMGGSSKEGNPILSNLFLKNFLEYWFFLKNMILKPKTIFFLLYR
jgi:hypothetical protein